MPKRKSGTSKAAWRERLEKFAEDPGKDEELLAASTEAYEVAWASYKFDKASQSVQNRRNLHKTEYETLITGIVKKTGVDVTEEDIWGADNIEHNLRTYLEMSAKMLCPRSFRSETLKFNTIVQRRQSMMFWLNRKCNVAVNRGSMWVASQEALHHAFRTYNKPSLNDQKIYLTKQDLLMLIQHNMYTSSSAELAQQHELAWLLAFIFGVRPGTIGTAKGHPDQFLPWGDIEIQRCGTNNFKAAVLFRWLKGYRNEELRPLRFKASEPRFTEDIVFGIGHRLVALALKRGYLEDYETVEELLNDDKINIRIKDSAKKMPVICASSPKGLLVHHDKPIHSNGLTAYLQRKALDYGLPAGITAYAWRRSAGTNVAQSEGHDAAKGFLGHNLDSDSLETAYNQGTLAMDAFSIAMGREKKAREVLLEDDNVSVNRIRKATVDKDAWVRKWVLRHEDYKEQNEATQAAQLAADESPDDEDVVETAFAEARKLNNVRRSLTQQARLAFQEVELNIVKSNMTREELEERKKELQAPGELHKMLLEAAKKATKAVGADGGAITDQEDDADDLRVTDLEDVRDRRDVRANPQARTGVQNDNVEVSVTVSALQLNNETPENEGNNADIEVATLEAVSTTFLKVLCGLEDLQKSNLQCRQCLSDDTVPQTGTKGPWKDKTYARNKLNDHLATEYHSPKAKWMRQYPGDKNNCPFPYNGQPCKTKGDANTILQHALKTIAQPNDHLLAAAKAGLFARDFDWREQKTVASVVVKGKKQEIADPVDLPMSALIPPRNLDSNGAFTGPSQPSTITLQGKGKGKGKGTGRNKDGAFDDLRIPTRDKLTESSVWTKHEEGLHGHVADTYQTQRTWLADLVDSDLREQGVSASLTGGASTRAKRGKRRMKGVATLRKRLADDLEFAWAEDADDALQPEDEEGDNEPGNTAGGEEEGSEPGSGGEDDDDDEE